MLIVLFVSKMDLVHVYIFHSWVSNPITEFRKAVYFWIALVLKKQNQPHSESEV